MNIGSIVWFEVPADDVARARNFYTQLFGWKTDKMPGPHEYWHLDTGGPDASPDGGDTWAAIVHDLPAVLSVEVQTLP